MCVCLYVFRYGGIHLGPDRFKHINNVARILLQETGVGQRKVSILMSKLVHMREKCVNFSFLQEESQTKGSLSRKHKSGHSKAKKRHW